MKKTLSLITLVLLLFAMCIPVFAAHTADDFETETIGDFVYEKGTNKIFGYTGNEETVEMPADCKIAMESAIINVAPSVTKVILTSGNINGVNLTGLFPNLKEVKFKEGITEISDGAFNFDKTDKNIETFILPSTLKKIGRFAFVNCGAVKTLDLPDELEEIGMGAFIGLSSLTGDITIPDTVTSMGKYVFASCGNLDKVHISENAVYQKDKEYRSSIDDTADWFGAYALNDKSVRTEVKEINIPKTIMRDKNCKFYADEITFDGDFTADMIDMVKESKWYQEKYLGNGEFVIADDTLLKYNGTDKSPVIPEGVKVIAADAFQLLDIDTVTLPKSLEKIERLAFDETTLKEIRIPKNVQTIEDFAFSSCLWLSKAVFESIPEVDGTESIFQDSVWLNYIDFRDNVICEDKDAVIPENFYSGAMSVNIQPIVNAINKKRGTNLEFDYQYIISPSDDTWKVDKTVKDEMEKQGLLPSDAESTVPEATTEPQATPEAVPKMLEVNSDMTIRIDDNAVDFPDAKPFIDDNDRTQIPIRAVAEMLDSSVVWDGETETVKITNKNGDIVILTIDSDIITVNGENVKMDTTAIIKNERTYIPVRFVAEALGLMVKWSK